MIDELFLFIVFVSLTSHGRQSKLYKLELLVYRTCHLYYLFQPFFRFVRAIETAL